MPDTRQLLSRGARSDGQELDRSEREALAKPYLQDQPSSSTTTASNASKSSRPRYGHRAQMRSHIRVFFHRLVFQAIQFLFSIYIFLRQTYHSLHDRLISILYHHHRTPELIQRDIRPLSRLPHHLSIILNLDSYTTTSSGPTNSTHDKSEALASLLADASAIAAWCVCAGIPVLSLYERTGLLKAHIPSLHREVNATFATYFPKSNVPSLHIRAPNHPTYSPPGSPFQPPHAAPLTGTDSAGAAGATSTSLNMLLLSATDGRDTLIDLTKTLTEMAQKGKLRAEDISPELIDAELTAASSGEPDLLIQMAAPAWKNEGLSGVVRRRTRRRSSSGGKRSRTTTSGRVLLLGKDDVMADDDEDDEGYVSGGGAGGDVCLMGYPPWQVRLTEIFHVQDNTGVDYQVFLRGLHKYAKAEMKFGR